MSKEMIISSSAHETRVAILEDDQVAEIFIEREHQRGVVGNLYKGRVSKVLPGMQSAFVDLGLERDGFLYVSDVVATFEGEGCTISQASASYLMDEVNGKTLEEVLAIDHEALMENLGKEIVQQRTRCATLSLDTLRAAIRKYEREHMLQDSSAK